ncbi:MAG: LysR family transcriptional regulator, partial [Pseudomonadota bacterium]|nr:LysR family transcriptional regulator [Pseudomonadota bacterium]
DALRLLDLKTLKVFITVADLANMTAAAKRLGLSQSAVSQAIRQLEESVGAVLIDRERRPLTLTAAGAALRLRGGALVAEAETLYKTVREQAGGEAQVLRIGMVDSFAATIGPALIKRLLSSAVHLHVSSGLSPGLGDALLERRLDMIVTTDPPDSAVAFERHRLLEEDYVLLLPKRLADTEPKPTLARLATIAPLVRFNIDSHIGLQIERYLRAEGVVPPHRLEIDTAESLVAMVAAEIGWALITPLCLLQARADPVAVTPMALPGAGFNRALSLVSRRGEYGELPGTIAAATDEIFQAEWLPKLERFAPWLAAKLAVG